MNVLEKFSDVKVAPDSRISDEDRRFCCAHQKAYTTAREELSELRQVWTDIETHQKDILRPVARESYEYEQYISLQGVSPDKIRNKIEALPDILISRIVSYFNAKYHVSIDPDSVRTVLLPQAPQYSWSKEQTRQYHETMEQLLLSYEDILEQIFIQLGGRTFIERAVDELKEKCHAAAWNMPGASSPTRCRWSWQRKRSICL